MSLRIRFQCPTGTELGCSIERLADGLYLDFSTGTFAALASVVTLIQSIPEDTGPFQGRFSSTIDSTPVAAWPDGEYCVTIHLIGESTGVLAELATTMHGGDDATYFPPPPVAEGPEATGPPVSYAATITLTPTPTPTPTSPGPTQALSSARDLSARDH